MSVRPSDDILAFVLWIMLALGVGSGAAAAILSRWFA